MLCFLKIINPINMYASALVAATMPYALHCRKPWHK